jgi:prepilin-type N-terminal cleavage/methylation domain-containing protein
MMLALVGRHVRSQAGFSLAELIIAVGIIGVGLVAVVTGFSYGLQGVEASRQQSTAVFLAEQRLEQVKATTFRSITSATFPSEAYGTVANAPLFRRQVTITDNPSGITNSKLVVVDVFYRPVMAWGVLTAERSVQLTTFVTNRN